MVRRLFVEAEVKGFFWMRGTRALVYGLASVGGFHTSSDKHQSIRYEGKTLQIRVAFRTLDAAGTFVYQLHVLADFADIASVRPVVGSKRPSMPGDIIYESEYKADDTRPPVASASTHSHGDDTAFGRRRI